MEKAVSIIMLLFAVSIVSYSSDDNDFLTPVPEPTSKVRSSNDAPDNGDNGNGGGTLTGGNVNVSDYNGISTTLTKYTDGNGDEAYIPAQFSVSSKTGEQTVHTGLVVIAPDGSEYVWVSTKNTPAAAILPPSATRYLATITIPTSASVPVSSSCLPRGRAMIRQASSP